MTITIEERNKIIAAFFGLKYGWWTPQEKPLTDDKKQWCDMDAKTFLGSKVLYNKDLKFHSSWEWLIPAYNKFLTTVDKEYREGTVRGGSNKFADKIDECKESFRTDVENNSVIDAFETLSKAIQWYNNQKDSNV